MTGNQASGTNSTAVSGTGVAVATFTLSGVVTETLPTTSTLLAGVRVAFVDGANQGKFATTGADGRYQITGVVNGGFTVSATLAGYTTLALPVGINGNTTLDFRLAPLTARTTFGPGQYRLTTDIPAGRYYSDPANGLPLPAGPRLWRHVLRYHRRNHHQLQRGAVDRRSAQSPTPAS